MSFNQFPMRFGKYIVLDRVSAGGMAEVYRAKEIRESGFSKIIAIKRMLDGVALDATMAPMFVDEAKLAAQLVHPNIAQTLELGRIDDSLYIAMELVWGRDLKAISKACSAKNIPFPESIACYVVAKAAEALDFAHNARGADGKPMRLVHRDVSPHNIMLDHDGEVKVIDFGVAKAEAKSSETVAGVIKGKFSYMAPEQVTGAPVDARTDIFALGIVLYELLSGERLYDGSSAFSIFDKVVNQPAPRLSSAAQVAPELDDIVARCLAKNPDERFESAGQLADALGPFRIQERNIVGPRETKALLKQLYPNDELEMREKTQRYQEIRERDCVDARQQLMRDTPAGGTEILAQSQFAADFVGTHGTSAPTALYAALTPAKLARAESQAQRPTDEIDPPPPRRSLAFAIGLTALAATVIVVAAAVTQRTPVELVKGIVADLRTTVPVVGSPGPPAPAPAPPVPTITTSADPPRAAQPPPIPAPEAPRPQVGTVDPPIAERPPAPRPSPPPKPTPKPPPPAVRDVVGYGYVSIGAKGSTSAKVFLDGHDIGYAPVHQYRVKLGSHTVKIIPYKDEMPGKPVIKSFEVGKDHVSDKTPLRLVVPLD